MPPPAATRCPARRRPCPAAIGPGGGRTGTVLLSPFIKGGTVSNVPYNHFATLATIEDIFGLRQAGPGGHGHRHLRQGRVHQSG